MKIKRVDIKQCEQFKDNPRKVEKKDIERLKYQIKQLGIYKPLIAVENKGKYTILGGNQRFQALQELGYKEVDISIVEAKTKEKQLEYLFSDNDSVASYDYNLLTSIIKNIDIDLKQYHITIDSIPIEKFNIDYIPQQITEDIPANNIAICICPICNNEHKR